MLRGLRLQLARRLEVRHQREVHKAGVVEAVLKSELARGLEKRQRLNVARDAADFAEHDVAVMFAGALDGVLDLVRDVRDDLHRAAQVAASALAGEHRRVDAAGRIVRRLRTCDAGEALVVAEVEVRLGAVVRHEDLSVLIGAHRARVDVQVRIKLLHEDLVATALQKKRKGRGRDALAERTDHATGDEDVFNRLFHGLRSFKVFRHSRPPGFPRLSAPSFSEILRRGTSNHVARGSSRDGIAPKTRAASCGARLRSTCR